MSLRVVVVFLLLVLPPWPGFAQAQAPLTLAQARAEARAHAPEVAELAARVRGAEAVARDAARAFRLDPSVSLTAQPGALTAYQGEFSGSVGLSLPIDVSGSWIPRRASADAEAARLGLEQVDGLRVLDESVALAVATLALTQSTVDRMSRVQRLQQVVADATRRSLAAGSATQLELDAVLLEQALTQSQVVVGEGERTQAQLQLARLLGRTHFAELQVEDALERIEVPESEGAVSLVVERDPRVRAVLAELRAAREQRAMFERMIVPIPTIGVNYSFGTGEIPAGSFQGPAAAGLSANWSQPELGLSLNVSLPVFHRQSEGRVRALARIGAAEARLSSVRGDVWRELQSALAEVRTAQARYRALEEVPAVIERELSLLERAVRAGELDAPSRSLAVRRLMEAGRATDTALFALRVAAARWARQAVVTP